MHTIDLQVFQSPGIDPLRRNVLMVKSSQRFRAAFEPIARQVMLVDARGLCSTDASRFAYARLRRPIWPLDPVEAPLADPAAGSGCCAGIDGDTSIGDGSGMRARMAGEFSQR
jgi:microcystin degradation protein MlrC